MTVFDIPGIEHADVTAVGTIGWRIVMHDGWYIHLQDHEQGFDKNGNPTKVYKGIAILWTDYDFSLVEICAEADLPNNAEILGSGKNDAPENWHEITDEEYAVILADQEKETEG